eukprot:178175-Prymnesium_polylepis.1
MQTCTHTAARGHVPACPDRASCLPMCLLVSINFRKIGHGVGGEGPHRQGCPRISYLPIRATGHTE